MTTTSTNLGNENEPRREREPVRSEVLGAGAGDRRGLRASIDIMLDPAQNPVLRRCLDDKENLARYSLGKINEFWGSQERFAGELQKVGIQINFNDPESVVKGMYRLQLACGFVQDLVNDRGEDISGIDAKYGPKTHEAFTRLLENYGPAGVDMADPREERIFGLGIENDPLYKHVIEDSSEVARRATFSKNFIRSTQWNLAGFRDAVRNSTGKDLNFRNNWECFSGVYYLQKTLGFGGGDLDGMYGEKTHDAFMNMLRENGIDTPIRRTRRGRRA